MRDILFRGKDVYGNWIYGDLINLTDEFKQICNHSQLEHAHGVNPETVGQFTGLRDKNGLDIFEGDIVKRYSGRIYVVSYSEDRRGWYPFACGDGCGCCENAVMSPWDVEIVGNIHDSLKKEVIY